MYDSDRFDAEILLDRSGATEPFDTSTLCRLFNCDRRTIHTAMLAGRVPRPAAPCDRATQRRQQHEWSRDQVIDLLIRKMTVPPKKFANGKVCFV